MGKWDIPANINFAQYENPLQRIIGEAVETRIKQEENAIMSHITETIGYEIDKTELIRALNYDRDQFAKGYKAGLNADRWISVKDRLPEEYGEYLITWITSQSKRPFIAICECEISNIYNHEKNRFDAVWLLYDYIKAYPDVEVIAWMELPKPYEERSGEEE